MAAISDKAILKDYAQGMTIDALAIKVANAEQIGLRKAKSQVQEVIYKSQLPKREE